MLVEEFLPRPGVFYLFIVNTDPSILFGRFDSFLWIRCQGRGTFVNSPVVKQIAEPYIEEGGRLIIIDLENCTGIDSTFMGTIAGLARRLMPIGGSVQIASPTDRARAALESLGLDALLEIEPPEAPWRGRTDEIRKNLHGGEDSAKRLQGIEQAQHVLDSHLTLSQLSEDNANKFKGVTETLKDEIDRQSEKE